MESVAEEQPTVALASTEMPRFADGAASMQELLGQLAESIATGTMGAEAGQPCGETGTGRNGCRGRKPIACVGTLDPRIPRTGRGASFPDCFLSIRSDQKYHQELNIPMICFCTSRSRDMASLRA